MGLKKIIPGALSVQPNKTNRMEYKKAIEVLGGMVKDKKLSECEKEAVITAISVLDCAALGQNQLKSYIKAKKTKREESMKW